MRWLLLVAIVILGGVAIWFGRGSPEPSPAEPPTPRTEPGPATFVGSQACVECHDEKHETWLKTAHAYALRAPTPETVAGRFDGKPIETKTFTATPERRGDDYWIVVRGKDGWADGDHRVVRVIGRTFEQAYLFQDGRGAWRVLPICWSLERGEWDITHEVLHDIAGVFDQRGAIFDTRTVVFNHGCAQCHATDYDVGHIVAENGAPLYRSRFLEGAVACESCHGPGSRHVADEGATALVHPRDDLDAVGVLESCGRCHFKHEWRYAIDDDPRVGFHDIAVTLNFDHAGFYADGRLSGLNYHGTTQSQSACYLKGGMSCLSCHSMHSGRRFAMKRAYVDGADAQCTQCHQEEAYADKSHSRHETIRCVDCHMPKFVKKPRVLHFLRDHSIRAPEPELTERLGTDASPNACNDCHNDKTAGWAREWKAKWWPEAKTRPGTVQRLADAEMVMALRRNRDEVATETLAAAARGKADRMFFRLTALRELAARLGDEKARAAVRAMLDDPSPQILQMAVAGVVGSRDREAAPALLKLLGHKTRTVRVEAAYALARLGWRDASGRYDGIWNDAVKMRERQAPFSTSLAPIVVIGDALGKSDEVVPHLVQLVQLSPESAAEGLHRRARFFTESGAHEDAVRAYGRVHDLLPANDWLQAWLLFDSADSLLGSGLTDVALGNWDAAARNATVPAPLREIARARLEAASGKLGAAQARLDRLATSLGDDPTAGEFRRRVEYARAALKR